MDTDSLLFSFKLDCPPARVIDRLDRQFDLFFPYKVKEEYDKKLRKGQLQEYDDLIPDINLFFERKSRENRIKEEKVYLHCLKYLGKYFGAVGKQKEYYSLGDGEKHCTALGLYISRVTRDCVVIATDDFGAREAGIDLFVCGQFVGLVHSLLGTMMFVYCVNTDIAEARMLGLATDYFHLNPPRHANMREFKERISKAIKLCCRGFNYDHCRVSCLT
jgi:hypothetical protein